MFFASGRNTKIITLWIIAILAIGVSLSSTTHAQTLYGGGLDLGWLSTKPKARINELSKAGPIGGVAAGFSLFPTPATVISTEIGARFFTISGDSHTRKQEVQTSTSFLRVDYRWRFGNFEPGILLSVDFGKNASLKTSENDRLSSTISAGPMAAYRWQIGGADLITYIASDLSTNIQYQSNRSVFLGVRYWTSIAQSVPNPISSKPTQAEKSILQESSLNSDKVVIEADQPMESAISSFTFRQNVFLFDSGSHILSPLALTNAKRVAAALQAHAGRWGRVEIFGHTDITGSEEANVALSERRAGSIRDVLVDYGIDANAIVIKGLGSSKPLLGIPANSPKNRRIELVIVNLKDFGEFKESLADLIILETKDDGQ